METLKMADGTEVVKLSDHNSTIANVRKNATKGMVDTKSDEYKGLENDAQVYRQNQFKGSLMDKEKGAFGKLNVNPDYADDLMKLKDINNDTKPEDIEKTLLEMKKEEKYSHYFVKGDSGGTGTEIGGEKDKSMAELEAKAINMQRKGWGFTKKK